MESWKKENQEQPQESEELGQWKGCEEQQMDSVSVKEETVGGSLLQDVSSGTGILEVNGVCVCACFRAIRIPG